jgi:hypothetical protein
VLESERLDINGDGDGRRPGHTAPVGLESLEVKPLIATAKSNLSVQIHFA